MTKIKNSKPLKWWFCKFLQIGQKSLFECYLGNAPSPCRTKWFPLYFSILLLRPNTSLLKYFSLLLRSPYKAFSFSSRKIPPLCFLLWNIFFLFLLVYNALSLRPGGVGGWSQFGDTMQNMHNAAKLRWSHWKLWKNNNFFRERQNTIKVLLAFFVSSITTYIGSMWRKPWNEKCFGHFP